MIEEITAATKYAPLHNPPALAGIAMLQKLYPAAKHVAMFDTAFFADMPDAARMYALPEQLRKAYMRFGYHGLSHANVAKQVTATSIVSVHLGSGCSVAAIEDGKPKAHVLRSRYQRPYSPVAAATLTATERTGQSRSMRHSGT